MFSWEVPTANQLLMFKLFIREPVSHATGTLATFVNVLLWRRAHGFLYSLDRGNPHIATSRNLCVLSMNCTYGISHHVL